MAIWIEQELAGEDGQRNISEIQIDDDGLHFSFHVTVGASDVQAKLSVNSESFEDILKMMFAANARATIRGFGATIEGALPEEED